MSDDENSQGYGGSMYAHSQADSIDDLIEGTISVCLLVQKKQKIQHKSLIISSPEPKAQGELIVWDSSRRPSVRPSIHTFKH